MSDQYQVLTYRVQRNEGQERLQRVVIEADAHRVDLRGELRLTQEVKVDLDAMEQVMVTLSPTPVNSETLPVVMGVVPESSFMLDHIPSTASQTLGLCSSPTRHLVVEDGGMMREARLLRTPSKDAKTLRDGPSTETSTHEELATVQHTRAMRKAAPLPMAGVKEARRPRQGRVPRQQLQRPSWEELNLQDEAPTYRRPRKSIVPTLFLLASAICIGAAIWVKSMG